MSNAKAKNVVGCCYDLRLRFQISCAGIFKSKKVLKIRISRAQLSEALLFIVLKQELECVEKVKITYIVCYYNIHSDTNTTYYNHKESQSLGQPT